jgi:hypothetical protein
MELAPRTDGVRLSIELHLQCFRHVELNAPPIMSVTIFKEIFLLDIVGSGLVGVFLGLARV